MDEASRAAPERKVLQEVHYNGVLWSILAQDKGRGKVSARRAAIVSAQRKLARRAGVYASRCGLPPVIVTLATFDRAIC